MFQSIIDNGCWSKDGIFKERVYCSLSLNISLSIVVEAGAGGSAAENHYHEGAAGNKQTTSKINLFLA